MVSAAVPYQVTRAAVVNSVVISEAAPRITPATSTTYMMRRVNSEISPPKINMPPEATMPSSAQGHSVLITGFQEQAADRS